MKSTLAGLSCCLLFLGCSGSVGQQPRTVAASTQPGANVSPSAALEAEIGGFISGRANAYDYLYSWRTDPPTVPRQVGDYVVYRFTGRHLPAPVMLTERVVGRRGSLLLVDQILAGSGPPIELRLRVQADGASSNRIVSVARLVDGVQLPFGTMTYAALMDQIAPPIDANEGRLASALLRVEVRGTAIDCEKSDYRVRVDGEPALLTVLQSPHFAWGDIGGELRNAEGELVYRAEIVEVSGVHSLPARQSEVLARAVFDPSEEPAAVDAAAPAGASAEPAARATWVAAQTEGETYEQWDALE